VNGDVSATWRYHDGTKHSQQSVRSSTHLLDYDIMPLPYKIYPSLDPISLPHEFTPSEIPALDAIAASSDFPEADTTPSLLSLARLCFFSNGITKRIRRGNWQLDFRAAACTGALFHIEVYFVCQDIPGLEAGVYHYGSHDHALRRLRSGDYRGVLREATGNEPSIAEAPVVAICTSTFWRNAWKYQARAYRHTFWDSGTILANLLTEAAAMRIPARLVLGFADTTVNQLLDIDAEREAAVSMVALGGHADRLPDAPPQARLHLPTIPLSPREVDYPAIREMHAASSLGSGEGAAAWRSKRPSRSSPAVTGTLVPLQPMDTAALPDQSIDQVIRRRGSARQFARESIRFDQLSTMLVHAVHGIPCDCIDQGDWPLGDAYLIVNAVDGLESGTYVLHPDDRALELLRPGNYRERAGALALGQALGAEAAVNVYFMVDLEPVLAAFGNRGYRVAQLHPAVIAGRLYLAAYALGLGATGLTFFDDEVTAFFAPHGATKSVMFLIALGQPAKRVA